MKGNYSYNGWKQNNCLCWLPLPSVPVNVAILRSILSGTILKMYAKTRNCVKKNVSLKGDDEIPRSLF